MSRLDQNEDSLVQRIARVFAREQADDHSTLKVEMGYDAALFAPRRGYDWRVETRRGEKRF